MEVVAEHNEGQQFPVGATDSAPQILEEASPIIIVADDVLAGVAAGHDVVDRAFIFDARSAWHVVEKTTRGQIGQGEKPKTKFDPDR
jgi:hypothetical protein